MYLSKWPDYFSVLESPSGTLEGYGTEELLIICLFFCSAWLAKIKLLLLDSVMGKAEGQDTNWHGHVTALTVAPEYRRLGFANQMMALLENVSETM